MTGCCVMFAGTKLAPTAVVVSVRAMKFGSAHDRRLRGRKGCGEYGLNGSVEAGGDSARTPLTAEGNVTFFSCRS